MQNARKYEEADTCFEPASRQRQHAELRPARVHNWEDVLLQERILIQIEYPQASAPSPQAAADGLAEVFEFLGPDPNANPPQGGA